MPPHGVPGSGTAPPPAGAAAGGRRGADYEDYGGGDGAEEYTLHGQRWYILAAFSLLSFQQCLFWITFSPVAQVRAAVAQGERALPQ